MSYAFVYGTLRKEGSRGHVLKTSKFLGQRKTKPEFFLFDLGSFPAMVKGGKTEVIGELYDISPDVLSQLDMIEGHPGFYRRTKIVLADGTETETYLLPNERNYTEITSGDWIAYSSR
jgi:gamma-glutamylaminecyclotransferase